MTATKINVKGLNLAALSAEQIKTIEAKLSAELGTEIQLTAQAPKKKLGLLEGKLDAEGNFACVHCKGIANFESMNEEDKTYAMKYGICPECAQKVRIAEQIKAIAPKTTYQRVGDSAKTIAESYIAKYADKIDDKAMALLTTKEWCQKNMGLHYPLFKEVPANISTDELKILVTDNKGKRRFGAKMFTFVNIADKQFVMTNDMYKDRVGRIEQAFAQMYPEDVQLNESKNEEVSEEIKEAPPIEEVNNEKQSDEVKSNKKSKKSKKQAKA